MRLVSLVRKMLEFRVASVCTYVLVFASFGGIIVRRPRTTVRSAESEGLARTGVCRSVVVPKRRMSVHASSVRVEGQSRAFDLPQPLGMSDAEMRILSYSDSELFLPISKEPNPT